MPEFFEGLITLVICGVALFVISEVCIFVWNVQKRLKKRARKKSREPWILD